MTVAPNRIKMTADQYLQLGEDPSGIRLELVDGEVTVAASPATAHAYCLSQLFGILRQHIKKHRLGVIMSDTDHILDMYNVRRPDLYYFGTERMHLLTDGPIRIPPDLAIEVISPGSERIDRIEKFAQYHDFGIPFYWIVDPQSRTAKAFKFGRTKYAPAGSGKNADTVSFPPFPNLKIDLAELWWPPQP
jgi:Uma2 family endonuclease